MIRNLLRLIPAEHRGVLTTYTVLSFVSVILRAASALLLVPLLGALFTSTPADALTWLGALTAVTAAGWLVDMILARIGYRIGFALVDDTQHRMADRLTNIPLGWFTADNTAMARQAIAASAPDVVAFVANLLTPFLGAVLLPAAITVGLFVVSWQLGVTAAITLPLLLGALVASQRIVRAADAADSRAHNELTERILEFARTQQALRASRRATSARSQTGAAVTSAQGATMRLLLFQIPGQLLFSVASQIALIALAGTVTTLAVGGQIGAPEAVALLIVTVRFLEPFTVLADLSTAVENSRGVLTNLRTIIDAPGAAHVAADAVPSAGTRSPRVEFRGVGFRYGSADAEDVLSDLDFVLEPGTTTAIVGPSGSGKSTILSLIAGLHTPYRGQILVDGADVDDLDLGTRRALVSMVFQHPYLFDGSIRDNVRAGHPEADDKDIRDAMSLARVDEIVSRLPDGESTRVGEAGAALSGGERQRVSIARALVKPAGMLLIDEATSALDTENESSVTDAIRDDPRRRTRVIIAHRSTAIRDADQVLFVDGGAIIEQGTIDELTERGGRFAEFWLQHEKSSGWRIGAEV
ncbi:ABC-type multidrug transport system, ATPase and permease component [Mycolicibacterium rhodesiae NBB3]|uniref:ABC-type multidrug transport system, ATPase and permease component n=1 Tax=Mycolicibacterium rhodesiae (strain NBB3) TaxID=710685 RepID=G8RKN5_MYCRN|nr:ABC transporter ATP-binding protein [Mycolicibacterium rhodesiae]AEV74826.1 ABC-type multidrug transport system, ATPase and permease component [Mycolicibacterium rhodesiae NBB3]